MVPCRFDSANLIKHFYLARCFFCFDEIFLQYHSLVTNNQKNKFALLKPHERMNLVIDAGNTFVKTAVYENRELIELISSEDISLERIKSLLKMYPIKSVIISDVSEKTSVISAYLTRDYPVIHMSGQTPCPVTIGYSSKETLGTDRIAAAAAGAARNPGKNLLIVQVGTCITYELVNKKGEYIGGSISPGLDMRFKALNTFTARLPLVKKQEISFLTGKTTIDSLLSGVINGCVAEIDGIIDQYKEIFPDITTVMGGGDTFFFDKRLKNRIFANENLVLDGLNIILDYNSIHAKQKD